MRRKVISFAILSAFALAGCGVKGDLQKAPPMWGDKAQTETPKKSQKDSQ